ncbi:HAD family hydrolase [Pseudonocardia eucalypti]|uniref:HAD family hydrolase n=1 Tax=Pseudonocardia eucalypti TaxID=648755 RepID=A0ABP9Q2J4_9PSEU
MRWVTFDCFGTLVDWRHGIANGADLLFPGRGADLLERYNQHEGAVQEQSPTLRYRYVMAEALRRAAADLGLTVRDDDASVLAAGIPYWPTFPDTRAALAELRAAGWRLALLTNCDRDIIGHTQRRLEVPVDAIVTAEDVGAYKPALEHFHRFRDSFAPEHWVHVAQSHRHDMVPARELGLTRVWINRTGEPDDGIAHAVRPDLRDLLATVRLVSGLE